MSFQTLKFNKNLYSPKSVKDAVKEYRSTYSQEADFKIMPEKDYTDVIITIQSGAEDNFANEFSNYILFLNLK